MVVLANVPQDQSEELADHSFDAESQPDVTLEDHVRFFIDEVARLREDLIVGTTDAQNDFMVSDSIFTRLESSQLKSFLTART